MKWALVKNNIVQNVISYDGSSPFTPPEGQQLMEVNNWVDIGENINDPEPTTQDNIEKQYTLDERKALMMSSLVLKRDAIMEANITVNGNTFFADNSSVRLLHEALTIEGLGIKTVFPADWILANGSTLNVTLDDMKAVASAIATRKDAAYANYRLLALQISTSDTPEQIDITTGWPS